MLKFLLNPIARRLFVLNSFDGILTSMGVVVGGLVAHAANPAIILPVGFGAAIALGVSGFSSAYLTELAERRRSLKMLEKRMLRSLKGTIQEQKGKKISLIVALVDGLAPFLAAICCLSPLIAAMFGFLSSWQGYLLSITVALLALAILGSFLGKISKRSLLKSSLLMLLVGIVTLLLILILKLGSLA